MEQHETEKINKFQTWWDSIDGEWKNWVRLLPNGDLLLAETAHFPARKLIQLKPGEEDMLVAQLQAKFAEAEGRLEQFEQEWQAEACKTKLYAKFLKLNDDLNRVQAIGNYEPLFIKLKTFEEAIQADAKTWDDKRKALIDEVKALAEAEDLSNAIETLKALKHEWSELPYIDKSKTDQLWRAFNDASDHVYERKSRERELKEAEMLENLDFKLEMVEAAEKLMQSSEWKEATEQLEKLMQRWRETGRTFKEKNEELWQRFITARNTFFERKHQYFESFIKDLDENYQKKEVLVQKAIELQNETTWNETTKAMEALFEEWKSIGRVPKEKADEQWGRFNDAREIFFKNKRSHFETKRSIEQQNLEKKLALLKQAEAAKDSKNWHDTTILLNELMEEWKSIGPVPRKDSDRIWNQFLDARRAFFARKDADRERRKERDQLFKQVKEKHKVDKLMNMKSTLKEEEAKLADFKEALANTISGPKVEELKAHLSNLIENTAQHIEDLKKRIANYEADVKSEQPSEGA